MSLSMRIRKLELLNVAKNNKTTMIWIEDISSLTSMQLESRSEIYIYLEI